MKQNELVTDKEIKEAIKILEHYDDTFQTYTVTVRNQAVKIGIKALKAQLAKSHRTRPDREKIAKIFLYYSDCPYYKWEELSSSTQDMFLRRADQILALCEAYYHPSIKAQKLQVELAKKQERERIDNIRDKAIDVIEYLTSDDDFGISDTRECKLLTTIYTLSHVARGHCLNPHEDWAEKLGTMWQEIKERE